MRDSPTVPEDESGRRARDFTDRVFFNAVLILKGVVLRTARKF